MPNSKTQLTGRRPATVRRHNPNLFLLVGNGRTGSTWLQTTLDQIPDVRTRREIKVRMEYQEPHPLHVYVDESTTSITDCIIQACNGTLEASGSRHVLGSKLIFDPYGFLDPNIFSFLDKIFGDDISIIFLKRSYASQFLSWKVRGVFHRLNETAINEIEDIDNSLVDVISTWPEPKLLRLALTDMRKPLPTARLDKKVDYVRYPLQDAIEDLLVLFYNDLNALAISQKRARHMIVDYEEIDHSFEHIAKYVGSSSSQDTIRRAEARPVTQRLDVISPEYVQPAGVLDSFSDCLRQALNIAADSGSPEQFWQWRDRGRTLAFAAPGFGELLNAHRMHRRGTKRIKITQNNWIEWPRQRPIYSLS